MAFRLPVHVATCSPSYSQECRQRTTPRVASGGDWAHTAGRFRRDPAAAAREAGARSVSTRVVAGIQVPFLTRRPELAAEWHPTRNAAVSAAVLGMYSPELVWWRCAACGHEWQATVKSAARPAGMSGRRRSKAAPMERGVRGAIASATSGPCARPMLAAGTPRSPAGRLPARILSSPRSFTVLATPGWTPVRCRRALGFACGGAARRVGMSGRPRSRTAPTESGPPGAQPVRGRSFLDSDRWRRAIPICMPSGTARATASLIRLRSVPGRGGRPGGAVGPAGTSGRPASNPAPSRAPAAQHAMPRSSRRRSAPAPSSCPNGTPPATAT